MTLRHIGMHNLVDPFLGLVLVGIGLGVEGQVPSVLDVLAFVVLLAAAVALLYALVVALMALAVLLVGADELDTVSFSVVELSRFPVQAYRQPLQTLLVVVPASLSPVALPVALPDAVPAVDPPVPVPPEVPVSVAAVELVVDVSAVPVSSPHASDETHRYRKIRDDRAKLMATILLDPRRDDSYRTALAAGPRA